MDVDSHYSNYERTATEYNMTQMPLAIVACAPPRKCRFRRLSALIVLSIGSVQSWSIPSDQHRRPYYPARFAKLHDYHVYNCRSSKGSVPRYSVEQVRLSSSKGSEGPDKKIRSPLEDDISKLLSISKDRTKSERPRPSTSPNTDGTYQRDKSTTGTTTPPVRDTPRARRKRTPVSKKSNLDTTASTPRPAREPRTKGHTDNSLLPPRSRQSPPRERPMGAAPAPTGRRNEATSPRPASKVSDKPRSNDSRSTVGTTSNVRSNTTRNRRAPKSNTPVDASFSSLLPPPLMDPNPPSDSNDLYEQPTDSSVVNGLSSWEQFLHAGASASDEYHPRRPSAASVSDPSSPVEPLRLPSIQDLFPPGLAKASRASHTPYSPPQSSTMSDANQIPRPMKALTLDGVLPVSELFYRSSQARVDDEDEDHDDEELPFSAEQSDAITSDENKVMVRQNLAKKQAARQPLDESPSVSTDNKAPMDRNRKVIRRGMDMLVGGIPINADPPQRSLQLMYEPPLENDGSDWASRISLNTRAFGPLLHIGSISKVPDFERGLFCESFCRATIKWDICPKDLHQIVKSHRKSSSSSRNLESTNTANPKSEKPAIVERIYESKPVSNGVTSANGSTPGDVVTGTKFEMNGECNFEIGLSRDELESGDGGADGGIFRTVCAKALTKVLERAVDTYSADEPSVGLSVNIQKLTLTETEDGYTSVVLVFQVLATSPSEKDVAERVKHFEHVYVQAMEAGDIALAIAGAAKEEERWPKAVRDRVVEECLFPDDDVDEVSELQWKQSDSQILYGSNVDGIVQTPFGSEDLYLGEGNQGTFYDYSTANVLNAPYGGEIGLRLVDSVIERAKQRQPRVIAIGDVHGCIDELQDLLRQCDYRPGDLVVFLGDLVCKGPDSISVVQMAREIGAIGVRGNHDFEVVRWHHAMKSGVDPPVFGSEHYHIASCLSKADMNWMYNLPWYISSKDLGALFVHAGFVSGIRLAKQNPRLMMNMRSVLPDGTVTSKFFNNWPWARLWDGMTVYFGHDADRGLQQYEHAIGLDTGCVYGGRLTACILPEKRLVSVSARREYFKYRRKHYD